jgi:uncharacterized delta-60 repeat protein
MLPSILSRTTGGSRRHARAVRSRPRLEPLEDRALLAAWYPLPTQPAGAVDPYFGDNGLATAPAAGEWPVFHGIAATPDGGVVAVGTTVTTTTPRHTVWTVVRYTAAGQPDPAFGNHGVVFTPFSGLDDTAQGVAVGADGKVVVYGNVTSAPGVGLSTVVRYTASGQLDPGFGQGGEVIGSLPLAGFQGIALDGQRTVLSGMIVAGPSSGLPGLACLDVQGKPDISFGQNGVAAVPQPSTAGLSYFSPGPVVAQPGGTFVMTYNVRFDPPYNPFPFFHNPYHVTYGFSVVRFSARGEVLATEDPFGVPNAFGHSLSYNLAVQPGGEVLLSSRPVAVQPDGAILTLPGSSLVRMPAGLGSPQILTVPTVADVPSMADLVRLTAAGQLDPTFGQGGTAWVSLGPIGSVAAMAAGARSGVFLTGDPTSNPGPYPFPVLRVLTQVTPPDSAQGLTVAVPLGTWFTTTVATFQVSTPSSTPAPGPSSFWAWVNWGDGSYSPGRIKQAPDGSFQVVGSHRYKKAWAYQINVQILAWPPGLVIAQVQGKGMAGGKAHVQRPKPLAKSR